jgi:hypothetical protein
MVDKTFLKKLAFTVWDNDFWATLEGLAMIIRKRRPAKLEGETTEEYKKRLLIVLEEALYPMYRLRQNPYEYDLDYDAKYPNSTKNYLTGKLKIFINEEVDDLLRNGEPFYPKAPGQDDGDLGEEEEGNLEVDEVYFDGNGEFIFLDFTIMDKTGLPKIWQA